MQTRILIKIILLLLVVSGIWLLAITGTMLALPQCDVGRGLLGCRPQCQEISATSDHWWLSIVTRCSTDKLIFLESWLWQNKKMAQLIWGVLVALWFLVMNLAGSITVSSNKQQRSSLLSVMAVPFKWLFYPLFIAFRSYKERGNIVVKILNTSFSLGVLLPLWILHWLALTFLSVLFVVKLAIYSGILAQPIPIAGTGSMYPTFPKGSSENPDQRAEEIVAYPLMKRYPSGFSLAGWKYGQYELQRGDIVNFSNQKTQEIAKELGHDISGFVKRIIAIPGDTLEIRDGFIFLNGTTLREPYTAAARSTFGGQSIQDCAVITVPPGQFVVLGDNRKGSNDSRHEVGFISQHDITHVLPWSDQDHYFHLWRDATRDIEQAQLPVLDAKRYLNLLNAERQKTGLQPLEYNSKLEQSAQRRAEVMLKFDDLSYEATRSGYTMKKAVRDVGYSNIILGEAPTLGYYTAEELFEYYLQFPDWKEFLLSEDFEETGLSVVIGELRGCPTQIVVQHFAGYKPPDYSADVISSWEGALAGLRNVAPGWQQLKDYPEFYSRHKDQIDRINLVIEMRMKRIESVVSTMKSNTWLSEEQTRYMAEDTALADQQQEYAEYLNKQEFQESQ